MSRSLSLRLCSVGYIAGHVHLPSLFDEREFEAFESRNLIMRFSEKDVKGGDKFRMASTVTVINEEFSFRRACFLVNFHRIAM